VALTVAGCGGDDGDGAAKKTTGTTPEKSAGGAAKDAVTVNIASFKFQPDPINFKYFCTFHRFMEGTVEVVE